ncbi:type 2 isopentenyl-diphosphate Delta-isomerase [Desertifilum sp. FACHB-1129]|uniref:Isopentenyl-diphosphate delta-isomerase n=1 Tax=Desertifilum tharense IPPAS B-1220 TaxID=1781255 RepID=A0A1E5QHV9_9CYAN|nr:MULTISPECIES: type 2 isopentenyl-diphosphate Delta-isomerase [Desertifilum]MDA0209442.1 type 2 isopentenyl-diphosphate Delta-isomerase [Cyanobacteria bacterium FC1]MBD2314321.1 type 2 isopentenyl-diphosphate Delta-isomerase [Desertifilum sp. FACHB-1129]MBD2324598.1 type 2 isopentenyl-diphosphate Delta-isomerase [Desertifilum sp. FACHB-866]MBD2334689.1 type 2 isopentenyl-diphosphate Delta-isomerase [Desertifilum sp. FACHB-868]OEJ74262.1 type 2 isopentenyl-diphosphate Delta-isomerase [Deserti
MIDSSIDSSTSTQTRKADHLRICLDEDVQCHTVTTGLECYRFVHCCLPELDRRDIDLTTSFLGQPMGAPLLISSMTGGTEQAKLINYRLAQVAQHYGLAMGVGSQRVAIENPDAIATFAVRKVAPDVLLFANLGAVQLNYSYGIEECERAIAHLQADALILHLNPLQECIQTNGDTNFRGLLDKIEKLCSRLPVPVIAKEVGNGISAPLAQKLINAGVRAIDVAGAGGTSWAKVESERAQTRKQRRLGQTFADWGLPTAECIHKIRQVAPEIPLIASGGLRNGLEVGKAIALGADLAGLAFPFLQAAAESEAALFELVDILLAELTTVLFCTGTANLSQLQNAPILEKITQSY